MFVFTKELVITITKFVIWSGIICSWLEHLLLKDKSKLIEKYFFYLDIFKRK